MNRTEFKKLVKVDSNGCWIWQRSLRGVNGYAQCSACDEPSRIAAHLAYRLFKGEIPKGKWILHKCDVPPCVRPAHLFIGTPMDNSKDMAKKGRVGGHYEGRRYNTVDARRVLAVRYRGKEFRILQGKKIAAGLKGSWRMERRSLRRSGWGHPWRIKDLDRVTQEMIG